MKNLFKNIPDKLPKELFGTLVESQHIQIERIVSRGHASPEEDWYDQGRDEFVLLLKGAALLLFEDGREVDMGPGDWLEIPAHVKHRVAWTDGEGETIWLAVHFRPGTS
jgi:cupin 2 domain-containing protein